MNWLSWTNGYVLDCCFGCKEKPFESFGNTSWSCICACLGRLSGRFVEILNSWIWLIFFLTLSRDEDALGADAVSMIISGSVAARTFLTVRLALQLLLMTDCWLHAVESASPVSFRDGRQILVLHLISVPLVEEHEPLPLISFDCSKDFMSSESLICLAYISRTSVRGSSWKM